MKLNFAVSCIVWITLSASMMRSHAATVTATDGGTAVYGVCEGFAIDFDATLAPQAVWSPSLTNGQIYLLNSVAIKNSTNSGSYYLGVYTSFSGGTLSGFQGVSDAAGNFSTVTNNWLTFTFSNLNCNLMVSSNIGSESGLLYFAYQSGTSAVSSPSVTLATDRFSADTYMTNSLATIIAFGGLVANRSPQYQATITPNPTALPPTTCIVNLAMNYQTIDGFGFSDGWSGTLSSVKNNVLYQTLGFSILRAFVNATNSGYITPIANIQAAHAAGAIVFATGWVPNIWNDGTGRCIVTNYPDYANWLNAQATNENIDYISPFNEPDGTPTTNNVKWTPTQIYNFIKSNAPAIGRPVIFPESIGFNDSYSDPVLNDPVACSNVTFVAGHFYAGGNYVHTNALVHGKHAWETEHTIIGSATNFAAAMALAKEVSDAMNNQFSAYCWWWVNDGDLTTDLVNNNGTIYMNGYVLGQFSRWIRPGMVRCATSYIPTNNVYITAYNGTNGLVIVGINTNTVNVYQAFFITNAVNANIFSAHRTSGTESMTNCGPVSVTNNLFAYTLPAQSITTFVQFLGGLPTVPSGLSATVSSRGQLNLTWNVVTNATSYNIKRSSGSGGPYTTVANVTTTNYADMVYYSGATYYYVVSAVNDGGESSNSVQVSATTSSVIGVDPVADAYVNDGGSANSNFGTATNLAVKSDGGTNTGYNRITYLQFDVHALTNVQSAKLILTPYQVGTANLAYELVTNDSWTEAGIAWSNQPGGSGIIFTNISSYTAGVPVTINLTAAAMSQATNDGYLSLRVTEASGVNTFIGFYSKEWPTNAWHPTLQVINPLNTPPVLAAVSNRTIGVGVTLNITNVASDSDVPVQTLTYSLLASPTNAVINTNSGVLTWRPLVTQANTTNLVTVMVADNGTPSLSATQSFAVTVTNLTKPFILPPLLLGGKLVMQVNGANGPDYEIQSSTNLINWSPAFTTNSPTMPFTWTNSITNNPENFFRIILGPPLQ